MLIYYLLLFDCYNYVVVKEILNCAIDYTNFKSTAFVFISFTSQTDTDDLDSGLIA